MTKAKKNTGILKLVFKEIIDQVTEEDAERLLAHNRAGGTIGFRITQSSRGIRCKAAFHPFVDPGVNLVEKDLRIEQAETLREIEIAGTNRLADCERGRAGIFEPCFRRAARPRACAPFRP